MTFAEIAQWATVVVAVLGVVSALLKEEIIRLFRYPKLTIKLEASDPYIVRIPAKHNDWSGWRYFIRMLINNSGNMRANDVEVFLSDAVVMRNNNYEPVPRFTPMHFATVTMNVQIYILKAFHLKCRGSAT